MSKPVKSKRKAILAWCLYDWANSAFPVIISTFVFATYFTKSIAKNYIIGTAQWGDAIAIAGASIAIISPILGAVADHEGRRKPWIAIFALLAIVAAASLWFSLPNHHYVFQTLCFVVIGIIGLEVANVFYNAMLSTLTSPNRIGRLSGWGWSCGYFGGLVALILCLILFIYGDIHWFSRHNSAAAEIRICGPFVAVWFTLFAWPLFRYTPDQPRTGVTFSSAVKLGLRQLYQTFCSIRHYKNIIKFLIARILYIDGLNTIFAFGGIYAAGTFHMTFKQVMQFGIAMNVAAGIGAFAFAWLDDIKGAKFTVTLSLLIMMGTGIGILTTTSIAWFWVLGMGLSICVGPVQAASRSLLIHIAPSSMLTEMFGLYAFSGKASAFLGPWILALLTEHFASQRIGMSIVFVFIFLGLILLSFVKEK